MKFPPGVMPRISAIASLAFLVVSCADQPVAPETDTGLAPPAFSASSGTETTPADHHLVNMSGGIPSDFADRVAALGGTVTRTLPEIGVAVVGGLSDQAAAKLAASRGIAGIDRDLMVQWVPTLDEFDVTVDPGTETDQSGASSFAVWQWNLRQIAADQAWLSTNQGLGATVAILDTGIDPFHPDLAGKVALGLSISTLATGSSPCGPFDETTVFDLNFHGSFVGGIVTSNGLRVASVAPDATLIGVKVLNCTGSGTFADIIAGIVHATNVGADVINMSLSAYFPKNLPGGGQLVAALNRATNFANRNGVLVVASAGNQGLNLDKDRNFTHVPSQSANVLSVGATGPFNQTNFDQLASYTNFGVSGVDVMAPGGENRFLTGNNLDGIRSVCSTFVCTTPPPPGGWNLIGGFGTSFAAPHAAGTAAVVESQLASNQNAAKLEHCVIKGADDLGKKGTDRMYSKGRINVVGAVNAPGC
jgi:subtilisin family serine protease